MISVDERGRVMVRALESLRVHPALEEIGWGGFLPEIGEAAQSEDQMSTEEPIFVTQTGLILSGFGRWRAAASRRVKQIECVEYSLTDEDALRFMLGLQRRRNAWNPFVRIRLALQLEKTLEQRALTNMQMGGKYKGSATLPKAAQIDVRAQIAAIAGVGSRNVSKVKEILEGAHLRVKDELLNGSISINRAHLLCRLPLKTQLEALTEEYWTRVASEVEEGLFLRYRKDNPVMTATAVLDCLQQQELQQPGSVSVHFSQRKRSVILVGKDLQSDISQSKSPTLP